MIDGEWFSDYYGEIEVNENQGISNNVHKIIIWNDGFKLRGLKSNE